MNGWLSSTSNWLKKQYFNSAHYLDILANQGDKLSQGDLYLFGIKFSQDKRKAAFQLYQSVLWFTYRENVKFQEYPNVVSDVGWGCMLRVGQMMLAQVLRIRQGMQYYSDQKWIQSLIQQFIDPNGKFSLERLALLGNKVIEKQPGQWYSSYDIAVVLKHALQTDYFYKPENRITIPSLKLVITTSQFSLQGVFKQTQIKHRSRPQVFKTQPCLLVVICRLGFQKPEESLLNKLVQVLKNQKNCVGILGGRPSKAHYIFGTTEKSFIYLDPHCVKHQTHIQSFLCETLFSMSHDKIDPSLGICFYLGSFQQMFLTHQRLRQLACNQLVYCHEHQKFDVMSMEIDEGQEEAQVYQLLE